MQLVLKGGRSITLAEVFDVVETPAVGELAPPKVPVKVRLDGRELLIGLFDSSLTLSLDRLAVRQNMTMGDGWLTVPSRDDGMRILGALGDLIGAPVPKSDGRPGPIERVHTNVSAYRSGSTAWLHITVEGFELVLELAGPNDTEASLMVSGRERWPDFSWHWLFAFVEGREPRLTRADDALLSSDEPWILDAAPLVGCDGLDLSEAKFGGERLFVVVPGEPGDDFDGDEEAEPPITKVLVWDAPDREPRVIVELPAYEVEIDPSPDGRWVAVKVAADSVNGQRLLLSRAADGLTRELISGSPSRYLGSPVWSSDSQRFAVAGPEADLDTSPEHVVFVFDVEAERFVDVCLHAGQPAGWDGADLLLSRVEWLTDGSRETLYARWPGGDVVAVPCKGLGWRSGDARFTIRKDDAAVFITDHDGAEREVAIGNADWFSFDWRGDQLADESRDVRVIDLASGTWRYLADRFCGAAVAYAANGRSVLFQRGNGYAVGAGGLDVAAPAETAWSVPAAARGAAAAALLAGGS